MSEAPASATPSTTPSAATYRAFISYNRQDAAIAAALATHLTRFARPWYRTRAMRVFLDKNSLSTDPSLGGALERALADSEWLILIASPASAASPWVAHEVDWWLAHRGTAKLIIARTAGVIAWQGAGGQDFDWQVTDALAPLLRGRFATEPLWADLEAAAASEPKAISNPAFRDGFLSVAAQIHGVSKDALWSRERVEQRTRLAFVGLASLMIATLVWGVYRTDSVSMDRKENILSLQLGAKAFSVLPRDATLAAQVALAGVAVRPSGIAASALRSAAARLAGDVPPRFEAKLPGAVDLAFSPRATRLAVLMRDGQVTVLDAATGRTLGAFVAPAVFEGSALAWGAGGHLAAGGRGGVRVWKLDEEAGVAAAAPSERVVATDAAVRALAFSADGAQLALALADSSVRIVSVSSGEVTVKLVASRVALRAVAFSSDGKRLATGAEDGEAVLWRLADATPVRRLRAGAPIASVDFNREGGATVAEHMLALADTSGAVRVVDADMAASVPEAAAAPQGVELAPPPGAGGVAARFVEGRCLVRAGAAGPVVGEATLGFERLFAFGRVATSAVPRVAMAVGNVPARPEPAPRPESSLFALLDAAGGVAVHDQPLCGDTEAVCRFADPYLRAPMAAEAWARWLPGDLDPKEAVQQAPGPACRALIDRVLVPTNKH